MGRGGFREGAGRKKGYSAIVAETFRRKLCQRIERKVDQYLEAWEALALGHKVLLKDENGTILRAYDRPPNNTALRDVFNRAFGQPEPSGEEVVYEENPPLTDEETENLMLFMYGKPDQEEKTDADTKEMDSKTKSPSLTPQTDAHRLPIK
ncbi:hypothetical protein HYV73_03150 [Candidatus Uhrbacteria bacterium]|nr:hypothetical protein [Candidatus Uhrbacteria bacterium]